MDTIADRIKKAMELREMKQSELVEKTKIGKSSISTYLSGSYEPKQRNIYKIAEALDVNESWLMGNDVPMERNVLTFDTRIDDTTFNKALQKIQKKETLTEEEIIVIKEEFPKAIDRTIKYFEKFSHTIDDLSKKRLITYYEALNSEGKAKLLERAEELTYIPKYQKQEEEVLEAAHERTDIKVTDEMRKHDDDLMRNDDIWNK